MNKEKVREEIIALRKSANVAYVGSVNGEGFPQIKGMLVLESESMKVQYFSTNIGSRRVAQFRANPKACVYYVDDTKDKYKGARFTGTIEVCTDHETKAILWRNGFELYYPKKHGKSRLLRLPLHRTKRKLLPRTCQHDASD